MENDFMINVKRSYSKPITTLEIVFKFTINNTLLFYVPRYYNMCIVKCVSNTRLRIAFFLYVNATLYAGHFEYFSMSCYS